MGKKAEKTLGKDKGQSSASQERTDDDQSKTPEPYSCTGQFHTDFQELCRRNNMAVVPAVIHRARRPPSPSSQPVVEEKAKPGKNDKKNQPPPPEPEPEPEVDDNGNPIEPPPKTYSTKDKFEYFKPSVQVEMDHPDKQDTVTEIFVRGWKIDEPMMTVFKQCWPKLERLQCINLWHAGLNDETLEMLASIVIECPNLKGLYLDNNPVKGEGWHLLFNDDSPVLNMSLRYNKITDLGVERISRALAANQNSNQKLLSLNLTGNHITDTGAEHLSKALRTNRCLLSLGLSRNEIGDKGAARLGEVLSRFNLTHEEIVERRKLMSEKGSPDRMKSPTPLSQRADSRDRPGSVRSTHAGTNKGGKSAKSKKDGKKDDDKGKGKKDDKSAKKQSSVIMDAGKTAGKKGDKTKGKGKGTTTAQPEIEPSESPELVSPLLDTVEHMENGVLILPGNRTLLNLNLSSNHIGEEGIKALLLAIQYQSTLALDPSASKMGGTGLMRLHVERNNVDKENEKLIELMHLMSTKDPFYKPPVISPDQESVTS